MTERQKRAGQSIASMMRPDALGQLAEQALTAGQLARRQSMNGAAADQGDMLLRHAIAMEGMARLMDVLRVPAINTTVVALLALPPDVQGIISGAAAQLLDAGPSRHRLVSVLRALLDKTS